MAKKTRKRPKSANAEKEENRPVLGKKTPLADQGRVSAPLKLVDYADEVLKWAIVVAAFILPLIVSPAGFDAFDLMKATTLYLLTILMLLVWLVKIIFLQRAERHRTFLDWPMLFFGLCAILATVFSSNPKMSVIGEYGRYETVQVLLAYVFIFYLASEYFRDRTWVSRLILAVLSSTLLISIYGIRQNFGWEWLADFLKRPEARSRSTLGNAVFFGGYLAMVFPLFVFGFFDKGKEALRSVKGEKLTYAAVYVVLFVFAVVSLIWANTLPVVILGLLALTVVIWMSISIVPRPFAYAIFCFVLFPVGLAGTVVAESRGAWMATFLALEFLIVFWLFLDRLKLAYMMFGFILFEEAVAAAVYIKLGGTPLTIVLILFFLVAGFYLFYLFIRQYFDFSTLKEKTSRFVEGLLLLVAAGVLLAFLTVFWGARGSPTQRMTELSDRLKSSFVMSGGTTATRFEIWKGCIRMISERPLLGFGPDQMIDWFPRYRTIHYTQLEGEMTMPDRAHNEVIQNGVNIGLFGLLAYFWVLSALGLSVHRHLKKKYDPLVLGLAAAVVGYFIQSLFSIAIIGITSVYWILIAVLAALVAGWKIQAKEKIIKLEIRREIPLAVKTVLALVLLAVAIVAGRLAIIPQEADVYYFLGNYASRTGAENMKMMDLFLKASQTNPYRSVYRQTLASIYAEKARISNDISGLKEAIKIVEEGLRINPRDEDLAVRLADSYLSYASNFDPTWLPKAEQALLRTVDIDPLFAHPRVQLNNLYISRREFGKVIDNAYWVLQVEPGNQEALYQMAFSYESMGQLELAYQIYMRLYNLNPDYEGVKEALNRLKPQ